MVSQPQTSVPVAQDAACFLDVDGTLLGFKDHPDDVVADATLRDLLVRLQTATGGAVALVSGRTIADLDRIMSPLVLPAGGTHGAELRFPDGRRNLRADAPLDAVRHALAPFIARHTGLMLEDKGAALAVHYRHAPNLRAGVAAFLDAVVPAGLMIQHGKMVAEVKSRSSSKASAISIFMDLPPFAGRTPIFIGDDLTDEHGFEAVNARGGVSIKVGDGPTFARRRLDDPAAVRVFLAELCGR